MAIGFILSANIISGRVFPFIKQLIGYCHIKQKNMSKKPERKNYNLTYAALKQKADDIVNSIRRDNAEFATRMVTPETVTGFEGKIQDFDDVPTDKELLADISIATEAKDQGRAGMLTKIRTIRTMAGNKYGERDAKYGKYGFENLTTQSDEKLCRMAKRVSRTANANIAELATEGLTEAFLTELDAIVKKFDDDIDNKVTAEKNRDIITQERIAKGNLVYKELVRLTNTGKDLWAATDEAKYNDYVIYDTPSGNKPPANTGSLVGMVTDGDKVPVEGVLLNLSDTELTAHSDTDGSYSFEEIPLGTYTLTATKEGYNDYVIEGIAISEEETFSLDIDLTLDVSA